MASLGGAENDASDVVLLVFPGTGAAHCRRNGSYVISHTGRALMGDTQLRSKGWLAIAGRQGHQGAVVRNIEVLQRVLCVFLKRVGGGCVFRKSCVEC